MTLRQRFKYIACTVVCTAAFDMLPSGEAHAEQVLPGRAADLNYGEVLFEYHQGRSFEALSLLDVASQKGGIQGHGDHPALIEGGLMLAYGMTREAKQRFEAVLQDQVSVDSQNAAWFYLGKVFYLEQDMAASNQALSKVDGALLAESKPELYREWQYLKNQLRLEQGEQVELRAISSIWDFYTAYNLSTRQFASAPEQSISDLRQALAALIALRDQNGANTASDHGVSEQSEMTALIARAHLTLGQWLLQRERYQEAIESLQKITFESVFSEPALFQLSVAATHLKQYGLALEALKTLQARDSFTPWLHQVPYALAFLYEQMEELPLALQAYQAAGEHYTQTLERLASQQQNLSEKEILGALEFEQHALEDEMLSTTASQVALGVSNILNDAYGHIRVQPTDFSFAYLLSLESFQLALRDLHELYKLKNALARWQDQLGSFDLMLDTRARQRAVRIQQTQSALQAQNANNWLQQKADYAAQIEQALANEDAAFFMDEQQIEMKDIIDSIATNLALLPDGEEKQAFQIKLDRMQAYFSWWIQDQYSVNRWAVERQLKGLNDAMTEFSTRRKVLEKELVSNTRHAAFERRVEDGQNRLKTLSEGIDAALIQAREYLVAIVQSELQRQQTHVEQYRLAAKSAEARVADVVYQMTGEQQHSEQQYDQGKTNSAPNINASGSQP